MNRKVYLFLIAILLFGSACNKPKEPKSPNGTEVSSALPLCTNGKLDSNELCDPKIAAGETGACPTAAECAAKTPSNACMKVILEGSGCLQRCAEVPKVTACADNDSCCPSGCDHTNDNDCTDPSPTPTCPDGKLDTGELCDPNITAGETGACPTATECAAKTPSNACMEVVLEGSGCMQRCAEVPKVTACANNDSCCPSGCDHTNDNDCADPDVTQKCDNGKLDFGEHCDTKIAARQPGACPTDTECAARAPSNACMKVVKQGSGCEQQCIEVPKVTTCTDNDGCCPSGCTASNDTDCVVKQVPLGSPCDALHTCQTGTCETFPNQVKGICTLECTDSTVICPNGTLCDTVTGNKKYCLPECTSDTTKCDIDPRTQCLPARDDKSKKVCYQKRPADSTVGSPCNDSTQCGADGLCTTETPEGQYKGGECTAECSRDLCPYGTTCINNSLPTKGPFCRKSCDPADTSSCREGYYCHPSYHMCVTLPPHTTSCQSDSECTAPATCADVDKRGYKVCQNVTGTPIGGDCTTASECQGENPLCEVYDSARNKSKCSIDCNKHACSKDSICITYGSGMTAKARCEVYCRDDASRCDSARHFTCRSIGTPPEPTYCGYDTPPANIPRLGDTCTDDHDCGSEGVCLNKDPLNYPNGYCSADCSLFSCPSNAICLSFKDGSSHIQRCMKLCNDPSDCGRGATYQCRDTGTYKYCAPK